MTMVGKEDVCMGRIDFGLKPKRTIGPACVIQRYSTDTPSIGLLAHDNKSSIDRNIASLWCTHRVRGNVSRWLFCR